MWLQPIATTRCARGSCSDLRLELSKTVPHRRIDRGIDERDHHGGLPLRKHHAGSVEAIRSRRHETLAPNRLRPSPSRGLDHPETVRQAVVGTERVTETIRHALKPSLPRRGTCSRTLFDGRANLRRDHRKPPSPTITNTRRSGWQPQAGASHGFAHASFSFDRTAQPLTHLSSSRCKMNAVNPRCRVPRAHVGNSCWMTARPASG